MLAGLTIMGHMGHKGSQGLDFRDPIVASILPPMPAGMTVVEVTVPEKIQRPTGSESNKVLYEKRVAAAV